MFPNFFQNGSYIEIYNAQSKDLLKNWKFTGKVEKEYDSIVKGYLHSLTVGGLSKMQIPPNGKQSIGVLHHCILFQLFLVASECFTIEIAVTDSFNTKRRIMLSSSSKETVINSLHCRIPLTNFPIGQWVHFTINIASILFEFFKNQSLRRIDSISLSANCKIKKICSMKSTNELMQKSFYLPIDYCNVLLNSDQLEISQPGTEDRSNHNDGGNENSINSKRYVYSKNVFECKQLRSKSQAKPLLNKRNNNHPKANTQPENQFKAAAITQLKADNYANDSKRKKNIPNTDSKIGKKLTSQYNSNKNPKKERINPNVNLKDISQKDGPPKSIFISSKTPQCVINSHHKEILGKGYVSNEKFTNTFNANNSNSTLLINPIGDSIEEIVDFNENNGTIIDDSLIKFNNIHNLVENKKNQAIDREEIGNYQLSIFNRNKLNVDMDDRPNEDDKNKKEFFEEVYNDIPSMSVLESNRPYTPPITKLIPIRIEDKKIGQKIVFEKEDNQKRNEKDIVFDKVLGCYYDPQRNVYFNIKNSEI